MDTDSRKGQGALQAVKTVDILHFNDFHRHLAPLPNGTGGVARLATVVQRARAERPDSVLLNLGDTAGDQSAPDVRAFDPIATLFNTLGVDVFSLGNHEFEDPKGDYATLRQGLIKPLKAQTLCANVFSANTGQPIAGTRPFTIQTINGIRVAFIGVVTEHLQSLLFPSAGAGLHVVKMADTLADLVPRVRARGADVVVVMAHDGLHHAQQLASEVPGIDVVLAAHDHNATKAPIGVDRADGSRTWVAEGGSYGTSLGRIRLQVDASTHRVQAVEGEQLPVTEHIPADPAVQKIVDRWKPLPHAEHPPVSRRRWVTVPREQLAAVIAEREKET